MKCKNIFTIQSQRKPNYNNTSKFRFGNTPSGKGICSNCSWRDWTTAVGFWLFFSPPWTEIYACAIYCSSCASYIYLPHSTCMMDRTEISSHPAGNPQLWVNCWIFIIPGWLHNILPFWMDDMSRMSREQ